MRLLRNQAVIGFTFLGALTGLLVTGCSGESSDVGTAREAGASDSVSICINNATGGPLGGDASNSTFQGGSFIINSGQTLCFDQLPSSSDNLSLSMIGEFGAQGWTVGLRKRAVGSGITTNAVACGDFVFAEPTPRECNSNQYLISAIKQDGTKKFTVTIADA